MIICIVYQSHPNIFQKDACVRQSTEVRFASFFSGGFTTMAVINPPESNKAKRTPVQSMEFLLFLELTQTRKEKTLHLGDSIIRPNRPS